MHFKTFRRRVRVVVLVIFKTYSLHSLACKFSDFHTHINIKSHIGPILAFTVYSFSIKQCLPLGIVMCSCDYLFILNKLVTSNK